MHRWSRVTLSCVVHALAVVLALGPVAASAATPHSAAAQPLKLSRKCCCGTPDGRCCGMPCCRGNAPVPELPGAASQSLNAAPESIGILAERPRLSLKSGSLSRDKPESRLSLVLSRPTLQQQAIRINT